LNASDEAAKTTLASELGKANGAAAMELDYVKDEYEERLKQTGLRHESDKAKLASEVRMAKRDTDTAQERSVILCICVSVCLSVCFAVCKAVSMCVYLCIAVCVYLCDYITLVLLLFYDGVPHECG